MPAPLARLLKRYADRSGATKDQPIVLNIVAHSHGGNVALEMLKWLPDTYFMNRLVMLGSPNYAVRPSFRVGRVLIAATYAFLIPLTVGAMLYALYRVLEGTFQIEEALYLAGAVIAVVVLNWLVIFVALLGDMFWHPFGRLLAHFSGRRGPAVYGPPQTRLVRTIGAGRIFNLISRHDEASVLLRAMAAPGLLYKSAVAGEGNWLKWAFKKIFSEPILRFLIFKASETIGEVYALGFSWYRVLLYDYDVARKEFPYSNKMVERIDVTEQIAKAAEHIKPSHAHMVWDPRNHTELGTGQDMVNTFQEDKDTVASFLQSQMKLIHSLYYQDSQIIKLVAQLVVSGQAK